jgi:triosephosphate isomerase (TIM)
MRSTQKIVIANWKMNPPTLREAKLLYGIIKKRAARLKHTTVVVCPPFLHLPLLGATARGKNTALGGQNIFWEEKGPYTGEVSPSMVKGAGAQYVIIGHSERRALGETNEVIAKKVGASLRAKLRVVLCVGEKERDHHGAYLDFLKEELLSALRKVTKKELEHIVIAYEPIWAIGKGEGAAMTPQDMHETSIFIRKVLRELYSSDAIFSVPIVYGGSVAPGNTHDLVAHGEVQGLLVGHKSLEEKSFSEILTIVDALGE